MASSSDSYNEALIKQRTTLLADHQQIKKEIQKSQLLADGLEHDLQIAQQAFSFAESSMIGRTKRLATLFGGILKSDDELIERIQYLFKSAEEDEKKAIELRRQIEEYNLTQTQEDYKIDDAKIILKKQNAKISERQDELQLHLKKLEEVKASVIEKQKREKEIKDKYQTIADLLQTKITSNSFFKTLKQKVSGLDKNTIKSLAILAEAAHVTIPDFNSFDAPKFFDSVCYNYEKLQKRELQQSQMNQEVTNKIQNIKGEIASRKKKLKTLSGYVESTKMQLDKKQKDAITLVNEKQKENNLKIAALQSKEKKHLLVSLQMSSQNIDTSNMGLDKIVDTECKILIETLKQLQTAREVREYKKKNSAMRLQNGITVVENAADAISVSNRKLIHNIKPMEMISELVQ